MTTTPAPDTFLARLAELIKDRNVAGISLTGTYESLTGPTVTPPAGTVYQDGKLVGFFTLPNGKQAATIASWGAIASYCEALLAGPYGDSSLADALSYPLVTFLDPAGHILTTSAELSHRQADSFWQLAAPELRELQKKKEAKVRVDVDGINQATRQHPDALIKGFPTAVPFGWWHSRTVRSDATLNKKLHDLKGKAKKNKSELSTIAAEELGYRVMPPSDSRSARLFSAEIIAEGVSERRRMAAKVDSVFSQVPATQTLGGLKLSELGLGSIPPTSLTKGGTTPTDVTYERITSHAFFSFAGLRRFQFAAEKAEESQVLSVALTLLLYLLLHEDLSLRAGTELRLTEPLRVTIERQGHEPEDIDLPSTAELVTLVRELGKDVGWTGPTVVTIKADSPLGKVLDIIDTQAGTDSDD